MSDSKDNPKPLPPDDFGATTPNIRLPKQDAPKFQDDASTDWEKTNYNYSPKDLKGEEWNKPSYNEPAPQSPPPDFNKTYMPNQPTPNPPPKDADWGMTQANIQLPYNQPNEYDSSNRDPYKPSDRENYGSKQTDFGATTPFINLPKSEQEKYGNPPPAVKPTAAKQEEEKTEEKKGIPGWMWATGSLLGMFVFALATILIVFIFFINKPGFDVVLKMTPSGSDFYVNNSPWGVRSKDGENIVLQGLKAGEPKRIDIKNATWTCNPIDVIGNDGQKLEYVVQCKENAPIVKNSPTPGPSVAVSPGATPAATPAPTPKPPDGHEAPRECLQIKKGDYAKAAQCAYNELDYLDKVERETGQKFTVEQLFYAMNLYIVNFASGKATISKNDMKFLERSSSYLRRLPDTTVVQIGGHTDNVGKDVKNIPLSQNRALAVKNVFVKTFKIRDNLFQTKGYGSSVPKESNDTEDGKFRNRRIEYSIVTK